MDAKQTVQYCYTYADNRKAEKPVILDLQGLSSVTDYFIIVSGSSQPHLRAIADEVVDKFKKEHGVRPRTVDRSVATGWVVIDYDDVMMHIMSEEVRERYDLESLWGDAPQVKPRRPRGSGRRKAAV